MTRFAAVVVLLFLAVPAIGQGPSADWQTVSTEHFRVHFPAEYEGWSTRAASRLEAIHDAVAKEVGYNPPDVIDVIIANPMAQANGLAWPLLDAPRIIFYTEPPGPDEQIGSYNNWIDLLAVHEVAHVIHMLRPSRNPFQRLVERYLLPLNPITTGAPRWVLEGYATVVEGRLTGAGRPSSTMRAMILREWAANGRLPSYSELDSDKRFLGMSMAYLAGSAYLEWLEQRSGPESLRKLWARMTARQRRSFDGAFQGVFGESPERLYGQFVAELTASAIAVNRSGDLREGEIWQETPRGSGEPAISPDGSQIAVVIRALNKPAKIVIWSTGPADEEQRKYEERIRKILERDPLDVAPVLTRPLPRKPVHSFTPPDGGDINAPRWTADGESILYSHRQPDRDGFLHHDLFIWTPATGANRRTTTLADVTDADPFPDGRSAVAVRSRFGLSQLVVVDLTTAAITPLTEPSLDRIRSHPRVSRDGTRIAYTQHHEGRWALSFLTRTEGTGWREESACPIANVSSPEWSRTAADEIIATVSAAGFADLHRLRACEATPITRVSSGALDPAPASDGRLFFMTLETEGFVLRALNELQDAAPAPVLDRALVPAIPPAAATPTRFAEEALTPPRPYGIGRQEWTFLTGENFAPSQHAIELGVRIGDVVGRLDTIALVSIGDDDAQQGVAVASAWRGWPIELSGHLFRAKDRRGDRDGLEMRAVKTIRFPQSEFTIEGGALAAQPMSLGFLDSSLTLYQRVGSWRIEEGLRGAAEIADSSHYRGIIDAGVRRGSFRLALRYQRDGANGADDDFELIETGGLPSSIIPQSAFARRVFEPALPVATLRGDSYEGRRIEATTPVLPFTMFWQEHRTDDERIGLAGLEIALATGPMPVLRLPAFDATLGVARIFDEPLRGRTRWWFGLRWRP